MYIIVIFSNIAFHENPFGFLELLHTNRWTHSRSDFNGTSSGMRKCLYVNDTNFFFSGTLITTVENVMKLPKDETASDTEGVRRHAEHLLTSDKMGTGLAAKYSPTLVTEGCTASVSGVKQCQN
jgi:hypothetical protein